MTKVSNEELKEILNLKPAFVLQFIILRFHGTRVCTSFFSEKVLFVDFTKWKQKHQSTCYAIVVVTLFQNTVENPFFRKILKCSLIGGKPCAEFLSFFVEIW
uniref:(northern house mosquito) hypothetical protein n=1 Tax=Culex pipiens TaxID=7175 RepID=A0A8D8CQ95_CULPI